MSSLKIRVFCLAILFVLPFPLSHAAEWEESDGIQYKWEVTSQSKDGKPFGCSYGIRVNKGGISFIEVDLTVYAEKIPPDKMSQYATLLVGVNEIQDKKAHGNSIKIHNAWIKTSTGSSVGKFERNLEVRLYFGYSDKLDFYWELLEGLSADGLKIVYQEKPDAPEKAVEIPTPPSVEQKGEFASCINDLEETIQGKLSGGRIKKKH